MGKEAKYIVRLTDEERHTLQQLVAGPRFSRASPVRTKPRKLDGAQEARLVALACSQAPEGRVSWTLRLLAEKLVELEIVETICRETVRQTLKKTISSPG